MSSIKLFTCIGVDFARDLLPHFISHYLALGVAARDFHVLVQSPSKDSQNYRYVHESLRSHDISHVFDWVGEYTSRGMWDRRRQLQIDHTQERDWVLNADVDELHEYPISTDQLIEYCERYHIKVVQGVLIDRVAPEGRLAAVVPDQSLWEQFPIACDLMCSIGGNGQHHNQSGTVKLMLHRADQLPTIGGHGVLKPPADLQYLAGQPLDRFSKIDESGFRFRFPFHVHHFKWNDTVVPSMQRRMETPGLTEAGREYGQKMLTFVDSRPSIDVHSLPILDHQHQPKRERPWRTTIHAFRLASQARRVKTKIRRVIEKVTA